MKRFLGILAVVALLASPAMANLSSDQVSVGDSIGFWDRPGSPGGEFGVENFTNTAAPQFVTFCVQANEYMYFQPGNYFTVAGITDHVVLGNRALSNEAAFLYYAFRTNALANGYSYDGSAADANSLQNAIWYFQGQPYSLDAQAQAWVAQANQANWQSTGPVRVLNLLWGQNNLGYAVGSNAQDMLTIVPAPGAALLVLLGLGLVGWVKKRLA